MSFGAEVPTNRYLAYAKLIIVLYVNNGVLISGKNTLLTKRQPIVKKIWFYHHYYCYYCYVLLLSLLVEIPYLFVVFWSVLMATE